MSDHPRFVVAEFSLDLSALELAEANDAIATLAHVLGDCRASGHPVEVSDVCWSSACYDGKDLADCIWSDGLAHDERLLLGSELQRCVAWTVDEDYLGSLEIDGQELDVAPGVARACLAADGVAADDRRAVACLVACAASGPTSVVRNGRSYDLHFIASPEDFPFFFRSVFQIEDTEEEDFFDLARSAFPRLEFAESLKFRRFNSGYALRDEVLRHLGLIDDRFVELHQRLGGRVHEIQQHMSADGGIDVSPESPQTHAGPHMPKRDVEHGETLYRCEWHSKIYPTVERIHFHPPVAELDHRVLIGIFVDHLPT